jgi:predicted RNase H-like nuclease (RuvC/YqgF family)
MSEILNYLQIGSNGIALAVAGWIYMAYIKNLRASVSAKDEQLKVVDKHLQFWKDKAGDFEKKTPEYIEDVLAKRIKHREEEIKRLDSDNTGSLKMLSSKNREVSRLKEELEKSKYFGRALTTTWILTKIL